MPRLLAVLSVVLAGAALVVVVVPTTSGEGPGRPTHARGRTAETRDAVTGEPTTGGGAGRSHHPASGPGRPRTLVIGSLGVRAPVVPVETSGDTLYPPDDPDTVGWWKDSAMPGTARGSTVVTGHTVSDGDGVFDNLGELRGGDRLRLVTETGVVLRYVVRADSTNRRQTLTRRATQLFRQSGPDRLVLVTCTGWNGEVYLSNQVVVATPARHGRRPRGAGKLTRR